VRVRGVARAPVPRDGEPQTSDRGAPATGQERCAATPGRLSRQPVRAGPGREQRASFHQIRTPIRSTRSAALAGTHSAAENPHFPQAPTLFAPTRRPQPSPRGCPARPRTAGPDKTVGSRQATLRRVFPTGRLIPGVDLSIQYADSWIEAEECISFNRISSLLRNRIRPLPVFADTGPGPPRLISSAVPVCPHRPDQRKHGRRSWDNWRRWRRHPVPLTTGNPIATE
jgi:hypothetical protein